MDAAHTKRSLSDTVIGIIRNTCPLCNKGKIFKGLVKMNAKCPHCNVTFEREAGYFVGAMSFSYFLAFFAILPTFLPLIFGDYPLWLIIGIPVAEAILISPLVFRFSRLIWIHLERRINSHE